MDLFTFIQKTEGLENALEFAIKYGILPDRTPRKCIKCKKEGSLRWGKNSKTINIPYMFVCSQRECRSTIAVGRNTLFDRITFPLSQALRLIYFWLLKVSTFDTANQLKLREAAVVEWFQIFREVCAFVIINYTKAIGGPGHVIEVCAYPLESNDESYKIWIFTGVDRNTGHNFAIHVEDLDTDTLWPVMKNYILPGSVIVTQNSQEFNKKEATLNTQSLSFVNPNKKPRLEDNYHLDEMCTAMKQYVDSEVLRNPTASVTELLAYEFLYFNRDGFCNTPVSQLIVPFFNDVKQVYPGFEKLHFVEFETQVKQRNNRDRVVLGM